MKQTRIIGASCNRSAELKSQIGGKGYYLLELERFGHKVPPWFAIAADAFSLNVVRIPEIRELEAKARAQGNLNELLEEIRRQVEAVDLEQSLTEELRRALAENFPRDTFLAVRSSAIGEDSGAFSFAGLHDSFLFVKCYEDVCRSIKRVWASAFNERALNYRLEKGIPLNDIRVAVVVQQMVDAAVSGVAFSANPTSGNPEEIVIGALYGLGEGLVSAGFDADTFVVTKEGLAVTETLADKAEEIVFDSASRKGTVRRDVAPERRKQPSLSSAQAREVANAALKIEQSFHRPQDIEFAFASDGTLFILQSRAITTAEQYGPAAGNMMLWDNSNIIESYSGVTSPLTFSFIKRAYTIVYHCFSQVMGISPRVVQSNQQTFANMLGLFRGQVYYNLLNWYRLIQLFPGFAYTRQYMESMMGVSESLSGSLPPPPGMTTSKARAFLELVALVLRTMWKFINIKRIASGFEAHFNKHYKAWSRMDFRTLPASRLMLLYYEMEDKLLWNWKAPIINDFFVMISYGMLKRLCKTWGGDEQGTLQNDLLSGEGGIESTEPTKMLIRMAFIARNTPALSEAIRNKPPETMRTVIEYELQVPEFTALFEEYLERYGFRCMNELKLEEYSLRDKPERVFEHLRNYLGLPPEALDLQHIEARERAVRREAEARVDGILSGAGFAVLKKSVFAFVLKCARLGVKNRENMRFARTKIYGLLRELFRAAGEEFTREGILDESQDVFFLTVEEIWDYVRGTAVTVDLRSLVVLRKREFSEYKENVALTPGSRFKTWGMAYHKNSFVDRRGAQPVSSDGTLRGTGCCPGKVSCEVKVIRDPSEGISLEGQILVAGRTDPGWVPLYPAAKGILIERGSILSHSAIVAREMGIPTIVGIPGLLETLKSGDKVEMDGGSGEVKVLERAE